MNMCSQVSMTTLKKANMAATRKALLSDLNKLAKSSRSFDHGDDIAAASSKSAPTTIVHSQTAQAAVVPDNKKADNCKPKILCVTSSNARETQGRFFTVGM
jgi:hypothetical protein